MHHSQLSRVVQDMLGALTGAGKYVAIGTAGEEDGSITATVVHVDLDGSEHTVAVRFSVML